MLVSYVYIVVLCFLVSIKCEDNVVEVEILKEHQKECQVLSTNRLEEGANYTLIVKSEYFINSSCLSINGRICESLNKLENANYSIKQEILTGESAKERVTTTTYVMLHKELVKRRFLGIWEFRFEVLMNYEVISYNHKDENTVTWACETTIDLVPRKYANPAKRKIFNVERKDGDPANYQIIVVPIIGVALLLQTTYIVCMKIRERPSIKDKENMGKVEDGCNNDRGFISAFCHKAKRPSKRRMNIAERPPLPLPADALRNEAVEPPDSKRCKYNPDLQPAASKNMMLRTNLKGSVPMPAPKVENSYDDPTSPGLQENRFSYKNHGYLSEEKNTPPALLRRQVEGKPSPKLINRQSKSFRNPPTAPMHLPAYPSPCVSKSFKQPKPAPRLSPTLPHKVFQLPPRQEPAPCVTPTPPQKALFQLPHRQEPALGVSPTPPRKVSFRLPHRQEPSAPHLPPSPPQKAFQLPQRQVPGPVLSPKPMKKTPVYPPPPRPEQRKSSDDEWVYEKLQPASKYMNNSHYHN